MDSEKDFLSNYKLGDYERPSVTADVAVFTVSDDDISDRRCYPENKLRLLLIKRGGHPFKDMWALPGGFFQKGETIEECAVRELYEETKVMHVSVMPLGVFSAPDRDPRGWIISNAYVSIIGDEAVKQVGSDDASDAQWFSVGFRCDGNGEYHLSLTHDDIELKAVLSEKKSVFGRTEFSIVDSGDIAFDHAAMICTALSALRTKAVEHDAILDFLPERFTLAALRRVQEAVMSISVMPANLSRMASRYVEETDEYVKGEESCSAKLYKRKNNT